MALGMAATAAMPVPASAPVAERGPTWASLTPAQKQALAPLQRDWPTIEPNRKQKWLEVALRFPKLPADERTRVQERMAEWARLTPAQRTQARMQFQEVRQLPAAERQAKWQAYQALPESERKTLAQRARPAGKPASGVDGVARAASATGTGNRNPGPTATIPTTHAVAPIVVQAHPGATTTTLSTRPPPRPVSPGTPKIAATAGYVDPTTLLPRRGPQGAASAARVAEQP